MSADHLILVDASGFAFRAFYSASARYHPDNGQPTGAIEVFLSMVWRMLGAAAADQPTMGVAVFDAPGANFRHKLFPAYKQNRDPARRVELDEQFPIMRAAAAVLGLTPLERAGYEADDVIATLAARARKEGIRVSIVSSDKDFSQCVEDGHIEVVDPLAKKRMREADVIAKFGVPPAQVPHVQALAGDTVDGIPGVKGCGLKTAAALVRRFESVEGILKNVRDCRFPIVRAGLKRHPEDVRLYLKLTTLRRNVPMRVKFEDFRLKPVIRDHLMQMLDRLGAAGRAESIFGLDPQLLRVMEATADPLAWWREELIASGQPIGDEPQCGFYARRLERGGQLVPARIWRDPEYDQIEDKPTGREILRCQVGDKFRDPRAEWPRLAMGPIPKVEYDLMMKKWGGLKPPPTGPIDLLKQPAPRNPKPFKKRKPRQ